MIKIVEAYAICCDECGQQMVSKIYKTPALAKSALKRWHNTLITNGRVICKACKNNYKLDLFDETENGK